MFARSVKQIIQKIGNKNLNLYYDRKTGPYWYFVYDDGDKIFATRTILVPRLGDLTLNAWIELGQEFVKEVENEEV